jgi:hypothetical protein
VVIIRWRRQFWPSLRLASACSISFTGFAQDVRGDEKQDWMGAFSDGVCWLITLPGFIIIASRLVDVPQRPFPSPVLFTVGAITPSPPKGGRLRTFGGSRSVSSACAGSWELRKIGVHRNTSHCRLLVLVSRRLSLCHST